MPGPSGEVAAGPGWIAGLPEVLTATMDLAVEALVYRGQVVRQVRLSASLTDRGPSLPSRVCHAFGPGRGVPGEIVRHVCPATDL